MQKLAASSYFGSVNKVLGILERSDPDAELHRVVRATCGTWHVAPFFFLIRSQAVGFNEINFNHLKKMEEEDSGS